MGSLNSKTTYNTMLINVLIVSYHFGCQTERLFNLSILFQKFQELRGTDIGVSLIQTGCKRFFRFLLSFKMLKHFISKKVQKVTCPVIQTQGQKA
jgi:hypothetical protein